MSGAYEPLLVRPSETLCVCPPGRDGEDAARRSVWPLSACFGLGVLAQALALSELPEAARLMAPTVERVGWPFALLLIGAALAALPAAMLVDSFGRRAAAALGASLGLAGGALAAFAIARANFPALCLGALWLGMAQGFGLFYRHIAALGAAVPSHGGLAVLAGGAMAALAAPLLVALSSGGGALLVAAVLYALSLALATRLPHGFAAPRENAPLRVTPTLALATIAGAAAWFVMASTMLRGPLSLAVCGAAPALIGGAMAWHLLAMYGPAALAARWPALFAPWPSLGVGLAALTVAYASVVAARSSLAIALAMLAVGAAWGLVNIGALRLLHERAKPASFALAAHDLCLLCAATVGALI
jgi:MFS family permease